MRNSFDSVVKASTSNIFWDSVEKILFDGEVLDYGPVADLLATKILELFWRDKKLVRMLTSIRLAEILFRYEQIQELRPKQLRIIVLREEDNHVDYFWGHLLLDAEETPESVTGTSSFTFKQVK